ncbi:MAG: hypothetical protein IH988_11070 [Planctomycetes bacterium]|nr:hypothetical protein [Planctomycetota bacterium]
MHEGTDHHIADYPAISRASDADMGNPGREDHLIRMSDRVTRRVGQVNPKRLEGSSHQPFLDFPHIHSEQVYPPQEDDSTPDTQLAAGRVRDRDPSGARWQMSRTPAIEGISADPRQIVLHLPEAE